MKQISINQISKSFGNIPVLKDITLDIEPGSFVTLLGPSGCGKTTLLRIIAGLEQADSGSIKSDENIFVDCHKGINLSPQQRQLGFVFQDYGLWPHMTVAENVAFPLQMRKHDKSQIKARVNEVLSAVRLTEHADKLPEKLSGGQQQRVSIARAIAAKPDTILFDEPLSNLDANLREELGQEIRLLARQLGLTCINVTHDRREAQILSDRIALMKDGVFHQLGTPEELFTAPVDAWTAGFLDAGNLLPCYLIDDLNTSTSSNETLLIPRNAFKLTSEQTACVRARVVSSMFLEDRHEVTAVLLDHQHDKAKTGNEKIIKLFTETSVQVDEILPLAIDQQQIIRYSPIAE